MNQKNQIIREAKSQLARLMANENLTVEHRAVRTAMFDVKSRVLTLPVWKEMSGDIYDTLVGHEIGHALETPLISDEKLNYINSIDPKNIKGVRHFLNVVEDARIERVVRQRYPGMRRCFSLGYKELYDREFFGPKTKDLQDYNLIDRINMYFKLGSLAFIEFLPEEKLLVKMVEDCETFDQAIEAAKAIYQYCKTNDTTNTSNELENSSFEESEDGEYEYPDNVDYENVENSSGNSEDKSDEEEESDEESDDNSKSSSDEESKSDSDEKKDEQDKHYTNQDDDVNENKNLSSETDEAWEKNQDSLTKTDMHKKHTYANIPYVTAESFIVPYNVILEDFTNTYNRHCKDGFVSNYSEQNRIQMANKLRNENMPVISYMVKEFEMRKAAQTHARVSISKTGVLNTNKLHSYKYNDDIFRRVTNVPKGKNHGLVMFIDWSSSMHYNMEGTIQQLINLVLFCKRVQIPFEVYAFSDGYWYQKAYLKNTYKHLQDRKMPSYGSDDIVVYPELALMQFFSNKMNTNQLNLMIGNLLAFCYALKKGHRIMPFQLNGTPLNAALMVAPTIVNEFRKNNKVEIMNTIILTDGDDSRGIQTKKNPVHLNSYTQIVIMRDQKTKTEYYDAKTNVDITKFLVMNLQSRTNSNIIGFHLLSDNKRHIIQYFNRGNEEVLTPEQEQKIISEFRTKNFLVSETNGYSHYYILKDGQELRIEQSDLKFDADSSTKKIAKEFFKYAKKKLENRVVLNKFIAEIS